MRNIFLINAGSEQLLQRQTLLMMFSRHSERKSREKFLKVLFHYLNQFHLITYCILKIDIFTVERVLEMATKNKKRRGMLRKTKEENLNIMKKRIHHLVNKAEQGVKAIQIRLIAASAQKDKLEKQLINQSSGTQARTYNTSTNYQTKTQSQMNIESK